MLAMREKERERERQIKSLKWIFCIREKMKNTLGDIFPSNPERNCPFPIHRRWIGCLTLPFLFELMHDNEDGTDKNCRYFHRRHQSQLCAVFVKISWTSTRLSYMMRCGYARFGEIWGKTFTSFYYCNMHCALFEYIACCVYCVQQPSRRNLKDKTSESLLLLKRKRHWIYEWTRVMRFGEKCKETKRQGNDSTRHDTTFTHSWTHLRYLILEIPLTLGYCFIPSFQIELVFVCGCVTSI